MKELIQKMKTQFIDLFIKYSSDELYLQELWNEVYNNYSSASRYYHTLEHLAFMFKTISDYENKLKNKDAVLFAVWFHDIIYNSSKSDNEEKSAEYAKIVLDKLNVPKELIAKVTDMILLTKNHVVDNDSDFETNLFLDADLAILGESREDYTKYKEGVRKEYRQYPDILYNVGRKKVLKQFREETHIYKTEELRSKLEEKAKENINYELKQLSI